MAPRVLRRKRSVSGRYSSKQLRRQAMSSSCQPSLSVANCSQLSMMLRHCWPPSVEMYTIPARLTVAGVACARSRISKIMRMWGARGIRSFDARDDPLGVVVGDVVEITHDLGQHAILPLSRGGRYVAVELRRSHGLRVQVHHLGLAPLQLGARKRAGAPALRLACARRAHDEDAVPDGQELLELHDLEAEIIVGVVLELGARVVHALLQRSVALARRVHSGEEVTKEPEEDDGVLGHDLGGVGVSQRSHEQRVLGETGLRSLVLSRYHQHRLDGSEAPVVVELGREQLAQERVQTVELRGEALGAHEAFGHEQVLADEHEVRNHHRHGAEERFEALGQLGTAEVAGIHGNEHAASRIDRDGVTIDADGLGLGDDGVAHGLELDRTN
eukprot:scaffold1741_cov262-Pinguiococcus_pyrenoidosus.AAC.7